MTKNNIHTTVKRRVTESMEWPEVYAVYRVELTPDTKRVVSSKLIEVQWAYWDDVTENDITVKLTPNEAQRLAYAIRGTVGEVGPPAEATR